MSTRANIIIKDDTDSLIFYRHSDGYPEVTLESLRVFADNYKNEIFRKNAMQSAGWLIVHGHKEYKKEDGDTDFCEPNKNGFSKWKVGAYEPTPELHGDIEYLYVIDVLQNYISVHKPISFMPEKQSVDNFKELKELRYYYGTH